MSKRLKVGRLVFSTILITSFLNTILLSWFNPDALSGWLLVIDKLLPWMAELGAGIIGTSWIRSIVPKPQAAKVDKDDGK